VGAHHKPSEISEMRDARCEMRDARCEMRDTVVSPKPLRLRVEMGIARGTGVGRLGFLLPVSYYI
jgi:hypothetical protein